MFHRFWERLAIRILLRSRNITMLAFKDRYLERVFMSASPDDPIAWTFLERNQEDPPQEPNWLHLERAFNAPDAESET